MHFVAAPALLRSLRLLPATRTCSPLLLARAINTTTGDAAGAGDPEVHSGDPPEDDYPERAPKFSGAEQKLTNHDKNKNDKEAVAQATLPPLKGETAEIPPPFAPLPKLESREVPPPGAPSLQQTRRRWQRCGSYHSAAFITAAEASGVGVDGTALRHGRAGGGGKEEEEAAVAELREYYKSHKPSPLSGVEVADTRKPITQAVSDGPGGEGRGVMADDALGRAERMFRAAAERGNPAWPHSQALARVLSRRGMAATAISA
ncbi:hypothetical protein ACMD2_12475 [Ananas comosus]|uniref:Uncharacterized protein n=1 Tax=Ananas comosus TaxID=4615 RepID=A0A199V4T6_ANACO|nr:hypothetical protein ACMD2_12475 [Ananas comosus]